MSDGADWTTLPVRSETRERVRNMRPEDAHSVDEFVNTLLDTYEDAGGVGNLEPYGGEVPEIDVSQPGVPSAEEIAAEIEGERVGYADVVAAVRDALRAELPPEALQQ